MTNVIPKAVTLLTLALSKRLLFDGAVTVCQAPPMGFLEDQMERGWWAGSDAGPSLPYCTFLNLTVPYCTFPYLTVPYCTLLLCQPIDRFFFVFLHVSAWSTNRLMNQSVGQSIRNYVTQV